MATVYETLKDKIAAKLAAETKFDANNIFSYPRQEFSGYPAATLIPIEAAVNYETTDEDEREYKFLVSMYYPLKPDQGSTKGADFAIKALFDLVDDVLDAFSTDRTFNSGITMPAGTVFLMVNPVFAGWGQIDEKDLLVAEMELNCRVSVQSSG